MGVHSFRELWIVCLCGSTVACGGVGKDDAQVSLNDVGIDATVSLPTGGELKKTENGAEIGWVGFSWAASFTLDGRLLIDSKEPLAQDPTGAFATAMPVQIGAKTYKCMARAKDQSVAERLAAACEKLAAVKPPPAPTAVPAKLELEKQSFSAKLPRQKDPMAFSARVPKGWERADVAGATLVKDPKAESLDAISITFSGFAKVDGVGGAEKEARSLDTAGLDTIADKRELAPGKFLVATAPRGKLGLTTVHVFVQAKGGSILAKCSGPAARKEHLVEICSSVEADGG